MSSQSLRTSDGTVLLHEASADKIQRLASTWPNGIVALPSAAPAPYGIPFQKGGTEVSGVKFQGPDHTEKSDALAVFTIHRISIAGGLKEYLAEGFDGVLIPCAYVKPKESSRFETGIAMFAAPGQEGKEQLTPPELPHLDAALGAGSCNMIFKMLFAVGKCLERVGLPEITVIGVDVRKRLQIGSIQFDFLVSGSDIICLKTRLDAKDPIWAALLKSGIREVLHLPSLPIAI